MPPSGGTGVLEYDSYAVYAKEYQKKILEKFYYRMFGYRYMWSVIMCITYVQNQIIILA